MRNNETIVPARSEPRKPGAPTAAPDEANLPAYIKIRDAVATSIRDGQFSPGARLPTARAIAEDYGVGVATAGRAIASLEKDGLVTAQVGSGTFVADRRETAVELDLYLCVHPNLLMANLPELAFPRLEGIFRASQRCGARLFPVTRADEIDVDALQPDQTGVVLYDQNYRADGFEEIANHAAARSIPVCVSCSCDGAIPAIGDAHAPSFEIATDHLLGLGHRRVAFLNYVLREKGWSGTTPARNRQGYLRSFRKRRMSPPPELYVEAVSEDHDAFREETEAAVDKLLDQRPRPTAIVCNNDPRAVLVLEILARRGIRVPEDVSVMGFDNRKRSETCDPPLTTVDALIMEQAEAAVRYVVTRLRGEDVAPPSVTPRLVERGTTRAISPLRRGASHLAQG